jgi:hypothetical protein
MRTAMERDHRAMQLDFARLTELQADTWREIAATNLAVKETTLAVVKLANSVSALREIAADHKTRLQRLEGGRGTLNDKGTKRFFTPARWINVAVAVWACNCRAPPRTGSPRRHTPRRKRRARSLGRGRMKW